jgi:hypothetical protein
MDQEEQWLLLQNTWWMVLLGMYYFARIGNALKMLLNFYYHEALFKIDAYYCIKFDELVSIITYFLMESTFICLDSFHYLIDA